MGIDPISTLELTELLRVFALLAGAALVVSVILLGWVLWRVRRIRLPADADFVMALRNTPLSVVLLLDALDFSLDFLSVPIAWTLLSRLGLQPLRGVTIVEELIPGTQLLPTMTAAWLFVRLFGRPRTRF